MSVPDSNPARDANNGGGRPSGHLPSLPIAVNDRVLWRSPKPRHGTVVAINTASLVPLRNQYKIRLDDGEVVTALRPALRHLDRPGCGSPSTNVSEADTDRSLLEGLGDAIETIRPWRDVEEAAGRLIHEAAMGRFSSSWQQQAQTVILLANGFGKPVQSND